MEAIGNYHFFDETDKARALAQELADGEAPEQYRLWVRGFPHRLDTIVKSISLRFTAIDDREVALAEMKGKIVLIDFWATTCGPCVEELPRVKAAWETYHARGLEVIGVSCDTDRDRLERFIRDQELPWPQCYDGKQQTENKLTRQFGVNGIPTMFLVDRHGRLRFDDVRARDDIGDGFETLIEGLLEEE